MKWDQVGQVGHGFFTALQIKSNLLIFLISRFLSFTITKILLEHHALAESQLKLCSFAGKLDKDEEIVFTSDDVENLKEDVKATQCSLIGSPEGVGSREIATITGT